MPRGPTLTFRVEQYSLMRDVTQSLPNPASPGLQFKTPPLVGLAFPGRRVGCPLTLFCLPLPHSWCSTTSRRTITRSS